MSIRRKQAKFLILATIIPMLVGTSVLESFLYSYSTEMFIITLIMVLMISIFLSLLASVFLRSPFSTWWLTLAQFLIIPLIGLVLGGLAFWPVMAAPQGHWLQVEPPPERAVQFLPDSRSSIFGSTIYIQGISGATYAYECITYQGCTWLLAKPESLNSETVWESVNCTTEMTPIPFLALSSPSGAMDTLQMRRCGPDFEIQTKYVLLEDGRILTWYRFWSVNEILIGIPGFAFMGLIAGIVTSMVTISLRKRNSLSLE